MSNNVRDKCSWMGDTGSNGGPCRLIFWDTHRSLGTMENMMTLTLTLTLKPDPNHNTNPNL